MLSRKIYVGSVRNSSPTVGYTYATAGSGTAVKSVRLGNVTYPTSSSSRGVIYYNMPSAANDPVGAALSRTGTLAAVATTSANSQMYAAYTYLGASTVVQVDHPAGNKGDILLFCRPGRCGFIRRLNEFGESSAS